MYNIYFISGAISLLFFVVLVAFILIRTKISYVLKFLLIPAVFAIVLGAIHVFEVSYGRPYYGYPTGDFQVLNFRNTKDGENSFIELWALEGGSVDSRVFKIPYDEETQKQLEQAKEGNKQGKTAIFKFREKLIDPSLLGNIGQSPIGAKQKLTYEFQTDTLPSKDTQ